MAGILIHQRCWNHELREAVCRCPSCGRHFCRECVTEHESRLLCAVCLQARIEHAPAPRRRPRLPIAPIAAAASLLLSWAVFYVCGQILLETANRVEQMWLPR